nr:dirigent protein 22-like [Ipomoea batatas]
MEKLTYTTILVVSLIVFATKLAHGTAQGPEEVKQWFAKLPTLKQKVTDLHFFFYTSTVGANPNDVLVGQSNVTSQSPTLFGATAVMDGPVTVGPDRNSSQLGRFQGFYALSSLDEMSFTMLFNFVFTHGEYNGSSLSVLGYNPVQHEHREMVIVGGSGCFRLARGILTIKTVWWNITTKLGDTVIECNVMLLHY